MGLLAARPAALLEEVRAALVAALAEPTAQAVAAFPVEPLAGTQVQQEATTMLLQGQLLLTGRQSILQVRQDGQVLSPAAEEALRHSLLRPLLSVALALCSRARQCRPVRMQLATS